MQLHLCPSPSDYHKSAAQWGESAHRNLRKPAVGFFNPLRGIWVLGQSCHVNAAEEAEANGIVGSTILCCSVAQRVIKQKIIANSLSEVSYSFVRLQVAPCEWWEMCLPQQIQENMGGRAGLPSEKPCAKTCSYVKLCCVCAICHHLTRVIMLQRRPSGPHFQQGWFPHALIMVCWSTGSNGWELSVFHAIELLYLWAPPESPSLAGFPLKPSTSAVFIKHFPSTPPTAPALHIKTWDVLSCLQFLPPWVLRSPLHSLQPTIAYLIFSMQLDVSSRCHGMIPAAIMLVVFMLAPNMTKPPSFRLEASGGTIAVWRRPVR